MNKRAELLRRAEEEQGKNKYLKPLNRIARRHDKSFYVQANFLEGRPISLVIGYRRWFYGESQSAMKATCSKLQRAGFNVSQDKDFVSANETLNVEGNKTLKELEKSVMEAFAEYPQ